MSLLVFNTEENLGKLEKFKLLPNDLQDHIGRYIDENYNEIWNYTHDWYEIIETIGEEYGWEYLINFLNKHLTEKIIGPLKMTNCKHMTGFSHTCVEFISCDERMSVGFYYDYIKMHPGKKYFWEEDLVDSTKATELIMDKLNEYLYSHRYDPTVMYKINKKLLDVYDNGTFNDDDWQVFFC